MTVPVTSTGRLARALLLVLAVAAGTVALPGPTRADIYLTVTPSLLDIQATPGASADQPVEIVNGSDQPVDLAVEIVPPSSVEESYWATDWLAIDQERISIPANGTAELVIGLTVPGDATSGGHYGNVRLTTVAAPGSEGAALAGEIVVPALFTVTEGDGELDRAVSVSRFAPFLEPDGRIGFRTELRNEGNIHVQPSGIVSIAGPDGEVLSTLDVQQPTPVMPGQTRELRAYGTLPLGVGDEYTATMTLVTGEDRLPLADAEVSFSLDDLAVPPLSLSICENLDGGPTVSVGASNSSPIGVSPNIQLSVLDAGSAVLIEAPLTPALTLWPEDSQDIQTQLPQRLLTGAYTLVGTIQVGADEPVRTEVPFEIGGTSPATAPLCGG